jgi:hypothetical protein
MHVQETKLEKMEAQLQRWGAKLAGLAAQSQEAGAGTSEDYRAGIEHLKERHRVARVRLEELKAGGSEKWESLKAGVDAAWKDLGLAFNNLSEREGR